jgi:hypothetical protein
MVDVKLNGPGMEQRIANRLRNSGGNDADITTTHGTGPTRTHTNIDNSPVRAHGSGGPAKPDGRGIDDRGRRK